jgi:hypothetical protein
VKRFFECPLPSCDILGLPANVNGRSVSGTTFLILDVGGQIPVTSEANLFGFEKMVKSVGVVAQFVFAQSQKSPGRAVLRRQGRGPVIRVAGVSVAVQTIERRSKIASAFGPGWVELHGLAVELGRIIQAALVPGFAGTLSNVWELRCRSALSWSMAGKRRAKTATARVVVAGAYSRDHILRPKRAGFGSTAQRQEKRGGIFATP